MLSELNHVYPNLYRRPLLDSVRGGEEPSRGISTPTARPEHRHKSSQVWCARRCLWERDVDAGDELAVYERRQSGRFAAKPGHHDDILMTRAIGLYVASGMPEPVPRRRSSFPGHYVRNYLI